MGVAGNYGPNNRAVARRPVGRVAETILRQVWALHLRRSGFRDLEAQGQPDAPLSNAGQPSHLWDGRVDGRFYVGAAGDGDVSAGVRAHGMLRSCHVHRQSRDIEIQTTAAFYRRMEHLSARFEDGRDQQIGLSLSDGVGVRTIKARLRVGQGRIERVAKQLRLWMAEPEDENDV